jgi:hypothetical protein
MNVYVYIDKAEYLEHMVNSWQDIVRLTENFKDYSGFDDLNIDSNLLTNDRITKIIINNESYIISRKFISLDRNELFIILAKG